MVLILLVNIQLCPVCRMCRCRVIFLGPQVWQRPNRRSFMLINRLISNRYPHYSHNHTRYVSQIGVTEVQQMVSHLSYGVIFHIYGVFQQMNSFQNCSFGGKCYVIEYIT